MTPKELGGLLLRLVFFFLAFIIGFSLASYGAIMLIETLLRR